MITGTFNNIFSYDSTIEYRSARDRFGRPKDLRYSILPNNMHAIFPYDYEIRVFAHRYSLDGRLEAVDSAWYIPIIGKLSILDRNFVLLFEF